jgi:calcineurin-like phosphoesterase family protein
MGRTFVYADPHFGHAHILTAAQRPWVSIDKMDADLVKLYNSVVKPDDVVYWVGDVTLKSPEKWQWLRRIVMKMNGTKILVFGNHDDWHWDLYLKAGFQSCHTYLEIQAPITITIPPEETPRKGATHRVSMCHDPAWAQDKSKLWICGHLHNCAFTAPYHIAIVSVELTEYKPVLIQDIVDGLRPGEGVIRTQPRPNREPKEWARKEDE